MELVVERDNLKRALKRVRQNKGSPGIDGMTVDELPKYLVEAWPRIREKILTGQYQPLPVRRHTIPKPGGGERALGIPTVLDRFVQQAILQVLQPRFDVGFSDSSYGFRPGRSAHQAVRKAEAYVEAGRHYVVDADLEKFFDRINHDVLMGRLAKRISDKRLLGLIRRYLEAGVLADGVVLERIEGSPQGGPLSPLLANTLLDEVDKELERRGHRFVRYADDLNVYVGSKRAGERVMGLLRRLFGGLRLQINESKSEVAKVQDRQFLGFTIRRSKEGRYRARVSDKSLKKLRVKVRQMTRRTIGRSMNRVIRELGRYLRGWRNYFAIAETPSLFERLDGWIRRRLRALQLKQWKRGKSAFKELLKMGARPDWARQIAANLRSYWRNSRGYLQRVMSPRYFDRVGLVRLAG